MSESHALPSGQPFTTSTMDCRAGVARPRILRTPNPTDDLDRDSPRFSGEPVIREAGAVCSGGRGSSLSDKDLTALESAVEGVPVQGWTCGSRPTLSSGGGRGSVPGWAWWLAEAGDPDGVAGPLEAETAEHLGDERGETPPDFVAG